MRTVIMPATRSRYPRDGARRSRRCIRSGDPATEAFRLTISRSRFLGQLGPPFVLGFARNGAPRFISELMIRLQFVIENDSLDLSPGLLNRVRGFADRPDKWPRRALIRWASPGRNESAASSSGLLPARPERLSPSRVNTSTSSLVQSRCGTACFSHQTGSNQVLRFLLRECLSR